MRIYIDFDDVLCETARHLSDLARQLFNRHVPYEAISGFDLKQAFSLSDAEIDALMEHAHRTDFLTDIAPAPGGLDAVRTLEERGHDLSIVTGRPADSHAGSLGWLRKHGLAHLNVIYFDKYGRAPAVPPPDAPKTLRRDEFETLHFDIAIDDSPAALDLLAPRRNCTVIVYDRPWNRLYAHAANMRRSASWPEIVNLIGGIA
ncbi:MAG TPA: 2-dehydropantoate 2-reductase [Kiritimatiellia bacterium]|nr:2-dehydropantoate 2-reductase [Kiritimatiellia bacterium]HPS06389.1 2-dehydropantoate 2-reductase [Kiritimatiellia bacterium]